MIKRGLLVRVDGPGRAVRHRFTRAGRRPAAPASEILESVLQESLGSLSPEQLDQLHAA